MDDNHLPKALPHQRVEQSRRIEPARNSHQHSPVSRHARQRKPLPGTAILPNGIILTSQTVETAYLHEEFSFSASPLHCNL
jgi:hypothetical protein